MFSFIGVGNYCIFERYLNRQPLCAGNPGQTWDTKKRCQLKSTSCDMEFFIVLHSADQDTRVTRNRGPQNIRYAAALHR
jgi:hypothetical protein